MDSSKFRQDRRAVSSQAPPGAAKIRSVQLLDTPRHRFALWTAVLIAVAAVTWIADLQWWLILVVVFGTWIVLIAIERRLERRTQAEPAAGEPVAETNTEEAPTAEPEPEPQPAPEPAPPAPTLPPEPSRRRRLLPTPSVRGSAPAPVAVGAGTAVAARPQPQKQWSIWTLDKVARETTDAELRYLVLSLQEYADADGMLPLQFDPLVRESFGELLGIGKG
jgi:hypothetical protein